MRIAIIGGASFSTPALLRFLDQGNDRTRMDVVLASRSRRKLDAVTRASKLIACKHIDIRTEVITANSWEQVLDSADCVLVQIRVGGFAGRLFDETFPHKYGLCGDEGLGAGGLSAGWRTWPAVADILDAIAKFAPRAFVIMMTSPLSLLVRAALKYSKLNIVGICELPWTTLQRMSDTVGQSTRELKADYFGVNHLGWFFNVRCRSGDLIENLANVADEQSFPNSAFLQTHRCMPTRYLRLHYEASRVFREQMSQETSRAEALQELQDQTYRAYENGKAGDVTLALERRPTPWYPQAVGPLLMAMDGQRTEIPFFLSVAHGSYTSLLEPNDVVEIPHHWVDGKLSQTPLLGAPPGHVVDNLLPLVRFERTATEAIVMRRPTLLVEALSQHPWIGENVYVDSIAREIVQRNDVLLSKTHQGSK